MSKTNLDSLFKTDTSLEKNGVWFEIDDTTKFLVRRFGGMNTDKMKKATALKYKPFARQVEMGTLPAEQERKIMVEVFVEACMVDWKGVEIDGQNVPFTKDSAVKLFMLLPDLFETLLKYASGSDSYKVELGNS